MGSCVPRKGLAKFSYTQQLPSKGRYTGWVSAYCVQNPVLSSRNSCSLEALVMNIQDEKQQWDTKGKVQTKCRELWESRDSLTVPGNNR